MRLNNYHVESTVGRLLQHRFSTDILVIRVVEAKLFAECIELLYTKAEHATLRALPPGFAATKSSVRVHVGGQRFDLQAQGPSYGLLAKAINAADREAVRLLPGGLPCAYEDCHTSTHDKLNFGATDEGLPARIAAHVAAVEALTTSVREAERRATVILRGKTRAGAIRDWPEIEPFLPAIDAPAQLPALPVAELNALFELPVS